MKCLIQKRDRYFYAWAAWSFQDMEDSAMWRISPASPKAGRNSTLMAPQPEIRAELSAWIAPTPEEWTIIKQHRDGILKHLVTHLVATRSDQDLLLQNYEDIPTITHMYTQEHKDFWATYRWDQNPWIKDDKGIMLSTKMYPLLPACTIAELHSRRVSTLNYRIRLPTTKLNTYHTLPKLGLWATAILMASLYLHEAKKMQIPAQLTLRNGPEVLNTYTWTLLDQGVTHGRQKEHAGSNLALIVLHQANDGLHWIIDHMTDVPEADQQELVDLQQRTRNTAHPLLHGFPWSLPPSINNMRAFKALQLQPFHRAKRKLHPALTAVITRLQQRDGSQDGNHFPMSQSPAQLWDHGHTLTEYQVWVCYRVATHQLNVYFPGRDMESTCKRHLACIGQHEGLLHILWDCFGALSRSAPELPSRVRADIEHMFPDKADIVERAWKRIWWIACSVCVTMLWIQRNRSIHKQESASTEQEVAEVKQVLLRQLRAVAIREQRRDKDVSKGVYLRLETEMFQDTINIRQPVLHSPRNRQETTPRVLEWLMTFQKSCKP